jgi:hypothetical protein
MRPPCPRLDPLVPVPEIEKDGDPHIEHCRAHGAGGRRQTARPAVPHHRGAQLCQTGDDAIGDDLRDILRDRQAGDELGARLLAVVCAFDTPFFMGRLIRRLLNEVQAEIFLGVARANRKARSLAGKEFRPSVEFEFQHREFHIVGRFLSSASSKCFP